VGKGDRRRNAASRRKAKNRRAAAGARGVYRTMGADGRLPSGTNRWGLSTNYPGTSTPRPTRPTEAYDRQKHYGGAQTDSPAGKKIRKEYANKPCPTCGQTMAPGGDHRPIPEHDPPLVVHYYEHGGFAMTDQERRDYARSEEAFNGAACKKCQEGQGAEMANKSKKYKKQYGL
jgi:hypothetical protein